MASIQDGNDTRCRYVFICGLHRSGTSVLGRNVARLENCTGFKALAYSPSRVILQARFWSD